MDRDRIVQAMAGICQIPKFRELAMKVEQGGPIPPSDLEYIIREAIREAKAEAEIVAQMKHAFESGDDATALDLARRLCQLAEETVQ